MVFWEGIIVLLGSKYEFLKDELFSSSFTPGHAGFLAVSGIRQAYSPCKVLALLLHCLGRKHASSHISI